MRLAKARSKITTTAAVVTVPVLIAVLALVDQGFPLARLDLNDGAVWLTATSQSQLGRYNAEVEELNGGLVAKGTPFDVWQDEGDVLLVEPGQVSVVDPASVTLTTQVAIPGAEVSMAAGVVAVQDRDGNAWARGITNLDGLRIGTNTPDLELGEGGMVVVARSGAVLGVAASDGAVTRLDVTTGSPSRSDVGNLGAGDIDQITAVGNEPVTLSGSTVHTLHGTVEVPGDGLQLQQPGPASSVVLVASTTALLEVPLDGGDVVEHRTQSSGQPAQPVRVGTCSHGAWAAGSGSYLRLCDDAAAVVRDLEDMTTSDELKFRVNRQVVALNDTLRGRLWLPLQDTDLHVPNWDEVVPEEKTEETKDDSESSDTTQDLVTECSGESAPPTAADDAFGVRPGRTTILPVIDNDSTSDCSILAIAEFDPLPPEFGSVVAIYGGRALQVEVAATAVGTVEFSYTITDGQGATPPSTADVRLTVRLPGEDDPPYQVRTGALTVDQGGQAEHQVLSDFVDPDGDDLLLVGATVDPAAGSVRFRQDGTLTFRADGPNLGRARVTLQVSDGTSTAQGSLDVDVRPGGSLAPQIDPVFAVTYVGQPVTLFPLQSVRSLSDEPPRLAGVDEVVGATLTSDLQAGTFTFSAARAGSYYVHFLVTASPQEATGIARIDVKEWPQTAEPPVAVRDRASLPAGGEVTIDPLENDSDPAGKVLVLQSVDVPEGSGLRVAVLDHHLVQIRSQRTLTEPVVLRYSVSNGQSATIGEIVVQPVPASSSSQPPVVQNVEVDVRTGGVVTIPVLDDAYDPDGDRPMLSPNLAEPLGPGEGLLFVSGDVLRYQAPSTPLTARATFVVRDATGNETAATLTVRVHESDASTKAPPRPRDVIARVFEGDTVRIPIPLIGIDPDGDGVTLLGQASAASHGRVTAVGPDWLEYQAYSDELDTDEFTYAVEDWTGQRAVAKIRVGISPRPSGTAPVTARDDQVTVQPNQRVEVRVLANDVDSSGGEFRLEPTLDLAPGTESLAEVDDRRIIVRAPDTATVIQIGYTVSNARGGRDNGVLTVTVDPDASIAPPIARDVVVNALDTLDRTEVSVAVLAVAQNPSGPLSDLVVSVPDSVADVATVVGDNVVVTLVDHAQTVPFQLTNRRSPEAASYAFITVPALGFFPPTPRPKAPELRVASGAQLVIPLDEQVQVAPGRIAIVDDPAAVTATKSDGTDLVRSDLKVLQFTSAPGYAGPASITVPVADGTDTSARTSLLTLQVTVYAVDDHPPTFTPSTIDLAPGEPQLSVDLRAFTEGPEGDDEGQAQTRYSYQLTSAVPAGFTGGIDGSTLRIAADQTTPKGRTDKLTLKIGYGRSGSMPATIDLRVLASTRRTAQVVDVHEFGVEGRESTLEVLENAYNPFPGSPLSVVGATVETPGAGTSSVTPSTVSVRPAAGFIGQMVTRFRVRDVTGDPDREVEGRIYTVVRGKPATPTAPRVGDVRDKTVVLSWEAPENRGSGIIEYRVVASPGNIVHTCVSTACTIDNLVNDTEYTFTVAARNDVDWSEPSPSSAPARPDAVPVQPGTPTLEFGAGSVRASWSAPVSTGSPITSYTLEISPAPPSGSASATSVTTSYTFSGLKNGTAYSVRVRAHNRAPDPGPWSEMSQPMVPAAEPDAPVVTATRNPTGWLGDATIDVTWTAPDGHGDAVRGYEVMIDNGTPVSLDAATTAYSFRAVRGQTYQIAVRATNKAGSSPWGTDTGETWSQPSAPTGGTAVAVRDDAPWGAGSVTLGWRPPAQSGGAGVTIVDYEIEGVLARVPGVSTTIRNLVGGTPVAYRVRAWNSKGLAGDWLALPAATPVTRPDRPTVTVSTGALDQVNVGHVEGGDGGSAIDQREYRVNGKGWQDGPPPAVVAEPGNVTVEYRVHNSEGWSEIGSGAAPAGAPSVPGAPDTVTVTPTTKDKVDVTWSAAAPNGRAVDGYRLTVVVLAGPGGTDVREVKDAIATIDLPAGTTVRITVEAHNAVGWGPASLPVEASGQP